MRDNRWYFLAYDISSPKRLQRIHRIMKKEGMSVQKSVFIVNKSDRELKRLLKQLASIILKNQDDVRVYPIRKTDDVWSTGGPLLSLPLVHMGQTTTNSFTKIIDRLKKWLFK